LPTIPELQSRKLTSYPAVPEAFKEIIHVASAYTKYKYKFVRDRMLVCRDQWVSGSHGGAGIAEFLTCGKYLTPN